MINLPDAPFKLIEADDSELFLRDALRSRKHYELCWCGSGKKYKKCHSIRQFEPPLQLSKVLHEVERVFWRKRGCMHPDASEATCSGPIVDAHTIQRKGALSTIVDQRNHVMHFDHSNGGVLGAKLIGWKKASTFPGFCAKHDSHTFALLENTEFSGSHEECVLQAFRLASNELYKKRALLESLNYQRDVVDRGFHRDAQIDFQLSNHFAIQGQSKSLLEIEQWWKQLACAVREGAYKQLCSKTFFFTGNVSVVSSAALHAEFDFSGRKLIDMWDLSNDAQMIAHGVMKTKAGGAIVFVWDENSDDANQVVDSFSEVPSDIKGDVFTQYCFVNAENTYFSAAWWADLPEENSQFVSSLAPLTFYEGGQFVPRFPLLVDWTFA